MIDQKTLRFQKHLILPILILIILVGCASKKNIWGDTKTGLNLTYRMDKNQFLQYQMSTDQIQNLEIMGQSMQNITEMESQFSIQLDKIQEENLNLDITVDSMMITINSMQGDFSPDLSSVIGKGFQLVLSPLGEELEFIGIDTLQFSVRPGDIRDLKSTFRTLFPDLPDKPIKKGDTWTDIDDFKIQEGNVNVHLVIESENRLSGFETINGLECIQVTAPFKGTMEGEGDQMGNDLKFKGNLNGQSTWNFAYKKGLFVNMTTDFTLTGEIEMSGGQNMTIPMIQETKVVIHLI